MSRIIFRCEHLILLRATPFVDDSTYQGNDIPGAPRQVLATEIKYTHPVGFSLTPSIEW